MCTLHLWYHEDLCLLGASQQPHDVGRTVADKALLACAVDVGAVETPLINGHLREQDQGTAERLPVRK